LSRGVDSVGKTWPIEPLEHDDGTMASFRCSETGIPKHYRRAAGG
jgi:hypothetical protein